MRFKPPGRDAVDPAVFAHPLLRQAQAGGFGDLLVGGDWPDISELERHRATAMAADGVQRPTFVAQDPRLLADALHYETRIGSHGLLATRQENWHDLLNALIWLRYPQIKWALNARQIAEIALSGPRQRTRAQCAITHFDEGGVLVVCADAEAVALWDAHDWHGLFHRRRDAWSTRISVSVFGHALLEHALVPGQLIVGKSLLLAAEEATVAALERGDAAVAMQVQSRAAQLIAQSIWLNDPQELRPLPLSGIPGWHDGQSDPAFYREAPCFRPVRPGRIYPPAQTL